ncbi:MAG TPA: hypothetical protein VGJ77_13990 [Gaiellaceae bacterium]|jgi:hypothetical protein
MSSVGIDAASGALVAGGEKLFPIGLSNPPPLASKTPAGRNGLDEVAVNGVNFVRTGIEGWSVEFADGQIANQREYHAAAGAHGLRCWLWLGTTPDLPGPSPNNERLLTKLVTAFRNDPALLAYKGMDEPRNPFRGANWIRPAGLVRAHAKIKELDPHHPVVIIQAPRSPVADLVPYRPAFDVTGVDIYPVSYPPGLHAGGTNTDVNVVGALARKTREAAGGKPFWMTLQIAWSGVVPTKSLPHVVPRFPTLQQERFMAYQAIVNGARGLIFFGGHLTAVMTPEDAASGWNWTFWRRVLRPVVSELASPALQPALAAPNAPSQVTARSADIELVTRRTATHLYVIAVRIGGAVSQVELAGLPGSITRGEVLFEHVQSPLPPPQGVGRQVPRPIAVAGGRLTDWFAPHDAHVYRFAL